MFTEAMFMGQRWMGDQAHGSQLWLRTWARTRFIRPVCQVREVGLYEAVSAFKQRFDPHPRSDPIKEFYDAF